MRLNLGVLVLVLCAASSLMGVLNGACSKSESGWARACRGVTGWGGSLACLACCALLLIGPFRSSVTL